MFFRALAVLVALLGQACSVPNKSHCGNLDGDATCVARDPARSYCSVCEAANDGCVAEPVTQESCHLASDSGAAASTQGPMTSTGATTGTPTTGTGTETSTGTGTSTSTSTTGTGTTEMSSGTDSSGTTTPVPMCGNDVAEQGETCDGADLNGKGCADFPNLYGGGDLLCKADCKAYDFSGCCKVEGVECSNGDECCSGKCTFGLPLKCG